MSSTRRRRACDSCYKRKICCDFKPDDDSCDWCQHHDIPCTYDRPNKRKRPTVVKAKSKSSPTETPSTTEPDIPSHTEHLSADDSTTPSADSWFVPDGGPAFIPPLDVHIVPSSFARASHPHAGSSHPQSDFFYFRHDLGTVCSASGLPRFTPRCKRWIQLKSGQWPRLQDVEDPPMLPNHLAHRAAEQACPARAVALPARRIVEALAEVYLHSDFGCCFPFIDGLLFQETLGVAYGADPPAGATVLEMSARACVFSFAAVACIRLPTVRGAGSIDRVACSKEAELLLWSAIGHSSTWMLQANLMTMLFKAFNGNAAAFSMYHGAACQIVFALGGHTLVPEAPPDRGRRLTLAERRTHHTRMLFWLCYILDKDFSLSSLHPPIINDEFCNLDLPAGYEEYLFSARGRPYEPEGTPMPPVLSDIRLVIIKAKAFKELYSTSAYRKSDAEVLLTIRELDEELERWRVSVPPDFVPSLSTRKGARGRLSMTASEKMLQIELHLAYYYLLSMIHCASGRCIEQLRLPTSDTDFGLQSSMDLSIEASRSTMAFLTHAAQHVPGGAFWVFHLYPLNALISIFLNLLRRPSSEYADLDLGLIRESGGIITKMSKAEAIVDTGFLDRIHAFINEVSRLAECAVQKYRSENPVGG